jgi:hypothetical protein
MSEPTEAIDKTIEPQKEKEPASTSSKNASSSEPQPTDSYVKLAMRNMVRKRGKSLRHFALTMIGLFTILIGLSYLTKP